MSAKARRVGYRIKATVSHAWPASAASGVAPSAAKMISAP
jgi:hypothetical protein